MSNAEGSIEKVYKVNERVLYQHDDNLYYDAKVVDVSTSKKGITMYTVHYKGWSNKFDETFEAWRARFRIRPFTQVDYEEAMEQLRAARQKAKKPQEIGSKSAALKRKTFPAGVSANAKRSNENGAKSAQLESQIVRPSTLRGDENTRPTTSTTVERTDSVCNSDADKPFHEYEPTDLPLRLKEILREDQNRTLQGTVLVKVPGRCSISGILSEYAKAILKTGEQCGKADARSIEAYCRHVQDAFDRVIGDELLMETEVERHRGLINSGVISSEGEVFGVHTGRLRACDVYGCVHLLRFLALPLDDPKALGNVSEEVMDALKETTLTLTIFLNENADRFFDIDQDYVRNQF